MRATPTTSISVRNDLHHLMTKRSKYYLSGLGYIGLGNIALAKEAFNNALQISPDFIGAKIELIQL
jgi:hypothetical protein